MSDVPSIKINTTTYPTIRSALTAAASGSTIVLSAGSFNITKSDNDSATPEKPGASAATLAGSASSNLTVKGAGAQRTTIGGNASLYARGVDGSIAPSGMRVEDLLLVYAGASGYIFSPSKGSIPFDPDAPTISNYSLRNVSFSGQHLGAVGVSGTYMDISGSNDVTFDAIKVSLSGQFGYDPLFGTGGGFFVFNEGGRNVQILNSEFDESGYSSSVLFFAVPDARVHANRFLGAGLIKQDDGTDTAYNPRGERFYNSGGFFSNNYLNSGAFFDYFFNVSDGGAVWQDYKSKHFTPDGTFGLRTVISGNTFDLLTGGYGVMIRSDSDASVVQKTLTLSGNTFNNGLAVRSELSTPGELVFGSNTVNGTLFNSLHVGGVKDDQLNMSPIGGSASNWLSGGPGNDQLNGASSAFDAFVFWAPLDSQANVDTIRGFEAASGTPDQIWLDVSRFAGLDSTNGLLDANSFVSNSTGLTAALRSQIIYNLSSGTLSYDSDGAGAVQGIAFAVLEGKPVLSAHDIFLFGSPQTPLSPALPSVSLDLTPASVTEDGTSNLTYTFTRSGSTGNPLTVSYAVGGTATLDSDYTGIAATGSTKSVQFMAGSATATVVVNPSADLTVETNETVSLTLAASSEYIIATADPITGVILNDDVQMRGTIGPNTFSTKSNSNTGQGGTDTFRLSKSTKSTFTANDFITDFAKGSHIIDASLNRPPTVQISSPQPTKLGSGPVSQLLRTTGDFKANRSSVVTFGASDARRTFFAINNSTAAFPNSADAITGYTGDLAPLQVI
ncbi:hypothetical protein NZK33_12510 [Cyanobium sp. FGCU-6]|nr:hypothetical protein [Cyanobium sp. FGCU6]